MTLTEAASAVLTSAITTAGLTKRFRGGQVAVDHIDLAVPAGSVYGFLGPNGSGKTTTIRMLLGLIHPTEGTYSLLGARSGADPGRRADPGRGADPGAGDRAESGADRLAGTVPSAAAAALHRVGALVEGPAFYPFLSGRQNLARCDAADRTADPRTARRRIDRALEEVGLLAAADKRYRAYSLGMKQRLGIAAGLLKPRDLMILDEPTNGLDPQGTREIRSLIKQIAAAGTTVFVSSHLLSEVEQICTHVGVMSTGQLVFQGTMTQLRSRGERRIQISTSSPERAARILTSMGLEDVMVSGGEVSGGEVSAVLGEHAPEKINAELVRADVPVSGLTAVRTSLEDLFVALTGEGFDVRR